MGTFGHYNLRQGVSNNTAFRDYAHEAVSWRRRAPDTMDMGSTETPVAPTSVGVSAAAGNTAVRQLKNRHRIYRKFEFQADTLYISPKHAYVAAGIDGSLRGAPVSQAVGGPIDRVAFGDTAEIDPQWMIELNPAVRPELDVSPGAYGASMCTNGPRQQSPFHQLRAH